MEERYPIGKFRSVGGITKDQIKEWIADISSYPTRLKDVVASLNEEEQQFTYRHGSWTVKQLVHHIADAQVNVYTRIKLALTEDHPTIKPFEENGWSLLPDVDLPLSQSLQLIEGLHSRLAYLLEHLTDEQLKRTYQHPETGDQTVEGTLEFCVWHVNHHLAHIQNALATKNN